MKFIKGLIITICVGAVGALVGYGATYAMKEQWRVEVEIQPPKVEQLGNYYALDSMYQLISENKTALEANAAQQVSEKVYQNFKQLFQSYDYLANFWKNSQFYQQRQTNIAERDEALLQQLIESTQFSAGDASKNQPDRILLTLDNPKQALELMVLFVNDINNSNRKLVYQDLIVKWKTLFNQVNLAAQNENQPAQGMNWSAKLNMMKSVSPLDDHLLSFNVIKSPMQPKEPLQNPLLWTAVGGAIGLLLGLLLALLFGKRKAKVAPIANN